MSLTESQKSIITATVPILAKHGLEIVCRFYETLFEEHPELRDVFSHTNQVTLRQQTALASSLHAYAANINDLTPILPMVEKINQRHASLNITPAQYEVVGEGVLRAMKQVLGKQFTDDFGAAWAAAYRQLADLMIGREEQIYHDQEATRDGWRGWRKMRVACRVFESDDITSFYLEPVSGTLPTFKAGQYVSIKLFVPNLGYEQTRQYSLSEAPTISAHNEANGRDSTRGPQQYRITVKKDEDPRIVRQGDVSSVLHDRIQTGDVIEMSHPAGEFYLDKDLRDHDSPVVLISAGVGMTPMMSMLQAMTQQNDQRRVSWIHVARNATTDAFAEDVKRLARQHKNVQVVTFHSSPGVGETIGRDFDCKGRPDFAKLDHEILCLDDIKTVYYICGPDKFMSDVQTGLKSHGISGTRIQRELFSVGSMKT